MIALVLALVLSRDIPPVASTCAGVANLDLRRLCEWYERDGALCTYPAADKEKQDCIRNLKDRE